MTKHCYQLSLNFHSEAAHSPYRNIDAEPASGIHGYTHHVELVIAGEPDAASGMITDLGDLRREIERIRGALDHGFVDEAKRMHPQIATEQAPDPLLPTTPSIIRPTASAMSMAGSSPPETTKSPMEISSGCRASRIRSSNPS